MDILGKNARHTSVMVSLYFDMEGCAYKEIPLNWADQIYATTAAQKGLLKTYSSFGQISKSFERLSLSFEQIKQSFEQIKDSFGRKKHQFGRTSKSFEQMIRSDKQKIRSDELLNRSGMCHFFLFKSKDCGVVI